jgi:hypothetical protein
VKSGKMSAGSNVVQKFGDVDQVVCNLRLRDREGQSGGSRQPSAPPAVWGWPVGWGRIGGKRFRAAGTGAGLDDFDSEGAPRIWTTTTRTGSYRPKVNSTRGDEGEARRQFRPDGLKRAGGLLWSFWNPRNAGFDTGRWRFAGADFMRWPFDCSTRLAPASISLLWRLRGPANHSVSPHAPFVSSRLQTADVERP